MVFFSVVQTDIPCLIRTTSLDFRLFRKLVDTFKHGFPFILDGSFVVIFNRRKLTYPLNKVAIIGLSLYL